MIDEDFEIIEAAFAIVTPWPGQDLFDIGMTPLLLSHCEERNVN